MVVADRTVRNSARDAEDYICLVKNLNDGHRAIGEAVIILTSSMRQFRLDKIEVCCGLQKLVRPMMLQGCCKADRAEVVERDRFATPNSLKSHGEGKLLSPVSNTCAITPKLCMPSRPVHPSKNYSALKYGPLPVVARKHGRFSCSCRAKFPGRVAPNFEIVSQSVKHKISVDRPRRAGIGSEKQDPRNSLSAAR